VSLAGIYIEETGLSDKKRARSWFRLGGRPAIHAASPRFVSCLKQHYFVYID